MVCICSLALHIYVFIYFRSIFIHFQCALCMLYVVMINVLDVYRNVYKFRLFCFVLFLHFPTIFRFYFAFSSAAIFLGWENVKFVVCQLQWQFLNIWRILRFQIAYQERIRKRWNKKWMQKNAKKCKMFNKFD